MKYIFWDIDGTLLLTGGAGIASLTNVIKEHYFLKDFKFAKSLAGRTDSEIIKEAVLQLKGRFHAADAANLMIRYHRELPKQLERFPGSLLYNVEPTLAYFQNPDHGYTNCLLTGNTKMGAKLKLAHYGIDQYFDFNHSAFGELSERRTELAKILWQRFYIADPQVDAKDFIFIGDTPNDVLCAQTIGAKSIVLLNGSSYDRSHFTTIKPEAILDHLPNDPQEFQALLDRL